MTEIKNPGGPAHDVLAANAVRNDLADVLIASCGWGSAEDADIILKDFTITWERDVNSAGVPVRRAVLRETQWEVDPEAAALPRDMRTPGKGDTVRFLAAYDEDISTSSHGVIPAGSEWVVRSVTRPSQSDGYALLLIAQPEWPEDAHIIATPAMVRVVRAADRSDPGPDAVQVHEMNTGRLAVLTEVRRRIAGMRAAGQWATPWQDVLAEIDRYAEEIGRAGND